MDSDLTRLLSEDEAARAGVESAQARARSQLDTARTDLARTRDARARELQQDTERSVAQILAEGDREVACRHAQREARTREDAARSASLVPRGAELWVRIVREGAGLRRAP